MVQLFEFNDKHSMRCIVEDNAEKKLKDFIIEFVQSVQQKTAPVKPINVAAHSRGSLLDMIRAKRKD